LETSQLIVGPDSATCALVAASIAPLAAGNNDLYVSLSVSLSLLAGALCVGASFLRLGALADFLSRPILVGFLNRIALSIALGQMGNILGFHVEAVPAAPAGGGVRGVMAWERGAGAGERGRGGR